MQKTINGLAYRSILENGLKNLAKNKTMLNDLNVFPVPDGDTGTNMLMTLRNGLEALSDDCLSLDDVAQRFATASVFGARGNSGVIVSQFFKGIADCFKGKTQVDCNGFVDALVSGYQFAYRAVLNPVEGTMLTVLRESADKVRALGEFDNVAQLVDAYLLCANASLQKTPELLPVLKKAGVVDSGAAGIVCFFEGVKLGLAGESILVEEDVAPLQKVDLTRFNKDSKFPYGYCTEGVLQLNVDGDKFDQGKLGEQLAALGDSIVMTVEGDKVKLHIHSKTPGKVLSVCQQYGVLLTVKVENMTVQNLDKMEKAAPQKFLYSKEKSEFDFAVVVSVSNAYLQQTFFDMGADVVILSDIAPSAQDFIDAFDHTGAKEILVFPNSSNTILTSMHAGSLYKEARVTVLNCRSVEECYLSLRLIDFDEGVAKAVDVVNDTLRSLYQVTIYHALKDISYGESKVSRGEFFSLCDKEIVKTGSSVKDVALKTVGKVLSQKDCSLLTLFYGAEMAPEFVQMLATEIGKEYKQLEVVSVPTQQTMCDVVLAFE